MADDLKPQSDFLDQSEIDKILAQTAAAEARKTGLLSTAAEASGAAKVEAYDFRNPAFLSEGELRRLRLLHEDFIRYLSARLSLYLRMEFGLKMAKLTTVTYSKFTDSLPNPTHISLFKVEPLVGVGVLDINPRLALTIADRLLGGRGHSVKAERYLTEIEIALPRPRDRCQQAGAGKRKGCRVRPARGSRARLRHPLGAGIDQRQHGRKRRIGCCRG